MKKDEAFKWLMVHTVCLDGITLLLVDEETSGIKHGPCFEQERKEAHAFFRKGSFDKAEADRLFGRWRPWRERLEKINREPENQLTAAQKRYEINLSKEDFKKAIFIDFEGFMNKPPALIGYLYDQKFVQIIFDDALKPAALAKGLPVREGKVEVANLLMFAKHEGRRIVAYTQFDKNVAFEQFGVDLSPVYADARLIAVKWLRRLKSTHPTWRETHPNWDIEKTPKSFLELIGYDRPPHLGLEKTTSRIKHVRDQLITWGSFEKAVILSRRQACAIQDQLTFFGERDAVSFCVVRSSNVGTLNVNQTFDFQSCLSPAHAMSKLFDVRHCVVASVDCLIG
jgi:hypothetical protein